MFKKLLLALAILAGSTLAQDVIFTKKYYIYTPITGSANVSEDMVQIFGSETRVKSDKDDTTATKRSPQRWMVWFPTDSVELADSSQGLSKILYNIEAEVEYTYYHSIFTYLSNGDTLYAKGGDSTFTVPIGWDNGVYTEDGEWLLYTDGEPLILEPTPIDTIPSAFSFTDVTDATISTIYTSNGVALTNFDSAYVNVVGGDYKIGALGDTTRLATIITSGDTLFAIDTSSASYSTKTNVIFTIGGIVDTFSVTTGVEPLTPDYAYLRGNNTNEFTGTATNGNNTFTAGSGWFNADLNPTEGWTNDAYGYYTMPSTHDTVCVGFRWYAPSDAFGDTNGDMVYFASIRDQANNLNLLSIGLYDSDSDGDFNEWVFYYRAGGSDNFDNAVTSFALGDTLDIEMRVITANGTGKVDIWINDVSVKSEINLVNDHTISRIVIGQCTFGGSADGLVSPHYMLYDDIYIHSAIYGSGWYE